jgi:hypothetical protein
MAQVRIVIALADGSADEVHDQLEEHSELIILARVTDEPHLLSTVFREAPQCPPDERLVVLMSEFDGRDARPLCKRLIELVPELLVYVLRGDRVMRYRSRIKSNEVSKKRLLKQLRRLAKPAARRE